MADNFATYDHLPKPVAEALREIEQFIYEADGKTLASPTGDSCFIDEGMIVAGDLAISFNTIVAALANRPAVEKDER